MTGLASPGGGQRAWLLATLMVVAGAASAQYKVVGPDGRVTYTDRPPVGAVAPLPGASQRPTPIAELPYAVRQAAARYPATLYTAPDCAPCDSARTLLRQRGIPVRERTIDRAEDLAELQRREGRLELPILRLGAQQLQGFEPGDWQATLDAAGYPRTSQLPPNWRAEPAQPLVPVEAEPTPRSADGLRPGSAGSVAPAVLPVLPAASGSFRF
ncbi:glutaredoxin domain-containing protein [Sphaerotilus sp.]|uniref:glutaredoxin domain-containing protein n=1 Tax=Sphaerotilus sp. TaxID=2093942 RepID=UPI002ACE74E2|nr:glutaredoxin domain-containing protein [Sphaerotilus sp.]MDZ7858148.1 glutaredoxin domain-containing protein [Sphaerotilus sp.]